MIYERVTMIRFIDLFAGIGGTRIGFEQSCADMGIPCQCVFTSEIKNHAIKAYSGNFIDNHPVSGDITKIAPSDIPDFDCLLAGFPCQPFSVAGARRGFLDERGNLFFDVLNILKIKKPASFLLENVEGLTTHDKGNTLKIIVRELEALGYKVTWKIIDASQVGVPQKRIRVYIVGHLDFYPNLESIPIKNQTCKQFIDESLAFEQDSFGQLLMRHFKPKQLYGKSIKDKRGGTNNIHSWEIGLKGEVTDRQINLLNTLLKKRRYKKWAAEKGIDWMDGMPLTSTEIKTFLNYPELDKDLKQLTAMGYLVFEHPKIRVTVNGVSKRVYKNDAPKGYNIVTGKLSFPVNHIIDPNGMCPTIVATEAGKIAVATQWGVRPITVKEGLAFSGFPNDFNLDMVSYKEAFDLLGNTVMPPVIREVSNRILRNI